MTTEYPKINGIFKRDRTTNRFIDGDWATEEFAALQRADWDWTEKVDGTNIRLHFELRPGQDLAVTMGGRTDNAQIPARLVQVLQAHVARFSGTLEAAMTARDIDSLTLHGEGYGAKIQKGGGNYLPDRCDFVLFDVRVGSWWLERDAVVELGQQLQLDVVQHVLTGTISAAIDTVMAGFPSSWPGVITPEGLVGTCAGLLDRHGNRIITKVKHKDFL